MNKTGGDFILTVSGLTKSFGELLAVNDLSFQVARGEIFGFLGPNGAGKTTTISVICGLLKADAGEICINGRSPRDNPRACRRELGLCPQHLVIWEGLTCQEQLEFMGRLYDLSPAAARQRAAELLAVFGLEEKRRQQARILSGGMKRRLNVALAVVHRPPLLILDEPQAGLDPQSRILVRETIRSLVPETTVILTTHEMDEAERLADRVAIIDHGKLLVLDTAANLKSRIGEGDVLEIKIAAGLGQGWPQIRNSLPANIRSFSFAQDVLRLVGADIPVILQPLLERFRREGLKIEDLTIRKKTLEDVFIALTGRRLRE